MSSFLEKKNWSQNLFEPNKPLIPSDEEKSPLTHNIYQLVIHHHYSWSWLTKAINN